MNQTSYQPAKPSVIKGSLFALAAFFFMAIFGLFSKAAAHAGCSALAINFITYFIGMLLLFPYAVKEGMTFLQTNHFSYHLIRAIFGLGASLLYIFSLQYIPLVNATLLFNAAPLFIPLLGIFLLGEAVPRRNWVAIIIGFIGISLIIQPNRQILENAHSLIGLTSGIFLAVAYLFIKKLNPTDPPQKIVFYFFLLASLMQFPFVCIYTTVPSSEGLSYAILAGISMTLAQSFLVNAYERTSAAKVGVFQYATVAFVGLIDWFLYGVTPPLIDLVGIIIVAAAGTIVITCSKATH